MKKEYYLQARRGIFLLLQKTAFLMSQNNYILCYHSFSGKGNSYSVTPANLRKQIKKLSEHYSFVSLDELFTTTKKNCIALTIDDGYEDVLKILPVIKKYQLPVTLFVLADPQKANRIELDHSGKLLTITQIKSLQKQGFVIGCHSMTHANFAQLSKQQLKTEIIEAKKILEKKLNTTIQYFAFPKGIYTDQAIKMVEKAGFKAAFTVISGSVRKPSLLTSRVIIDQFYSEEDIPAILNPLLIHLKNLMTTFKLWRLMPSI